MFSLSKPKVIYLRPFLSPLPFLKFWKTFYVFWTQRCRNLTKLFIWTCYFSQVSHALKRRWLHIYVTESDLQFFSIFWNHCLSESFRFELNRNQFESKQINPKPECTEIILFLKFSFFEINKPQKRRNSLFGHFSCWYGTDENLLLSQQFFSYPNKPICWTNKRVCYCFFLDKTFWKN